MKITRYAFFAVMMTVFAVAGNAQVKGTVDAEFRRQAGAALSGYMQVKDALVDSNAETASTAAGDLAEKLAAIDETKLTADQKLTWAKFAPRLKRDADHIAKNKDLEHQREHFGDLSSTMYSALFTLKINETVVYQHYCPMKKLTWLSESKDVKNPYYGKKMLDCGSVRATLKKGK